MNPDPAKLTITPVVRVMDMKSSDVRIAPGQHEIYRQADPIPWQRLKDADARLFMCRTGELYLWWTRVGQEIEVFTGRASYWSVQHCIMIERRHGSMVRASDDAWFAVITEPITDSTPTCAPALPPPQRPAGDAGS